MYWIKNNPEKWRKIWKKSDKKQVKLHPKRKTLRSRKYRLNHPEYKEKHTQYMRLWRVNQLQLDKKKI